MRCSSDTNPGAKVASGPTTRTRDAGTHITTSSLENRETSVDQDARIIPTAPPADPAICKNFQRRVGITNASE